MKGRYLGAMYIHAPIGGRANVGMGRDESWWKLASVVRQRAEGLLETYERSAGQLVRHSTAIAAQALLHLRPSTLAIRRTFEGLRCPRSTAISRTGFPAGVAYPEPLCAGPELGAS
jgi:hypothetical protein